MKKGDIVTVLTVSGEFVGRLVEETQNTVTLENPRMLVHTEQGIGFAQGVSVTAQQVKEITFRTIVFVAPTDDAIQKNWTQAVTGIVI